MKRDGNRYILKITYAIVAVGSLVVICGICSLFMSCRDHRIAALPETHELATINPAAKVSRSQRDSCPNFPPPPPPPNSLASDEENPTNSIQAYERFRQVGLAIYTLCRSISLFLSLSFSLSLFSESVSALNI